MGRPGQGTHKGCPYIGQGTGFPKFTNEVQHQTKVLPWGNAIRSLGLRNAVRLPAYVARGARSGKSQQLWIARHRRLLGS